MTGYPPKDLVVAVGIEGRIDVDQVDALIGELGKLFEVVPAVDDAGVDQRGGSCRRQPARRRLGCLVGQRLFPFRSRRARLRSEPHDRARLPMCPV
jgi:hypothetical protein